ncbi:hypothetical protein BC829DRAFT_412729 [Chytridium lagenaria]|nr:hypothetical protein BC829DRAFT_412729 [Chytridium lagenaria]
MSSCADVLYQQQEHFLLAGSQVGSDDLDDESIRTTDSYDFASNFNLIDFDEDDDSYMIDGALPHLTSSLSTPTDSPVSGNVLDTWTSPSQNIVLEDGLELVEDDLVMTSSTDVAEGISSTTISADALSQDELAPQEDSLNGKRDDESGFLVWEAWRMIIEEEMSQQDVEVDLIFPQLQLTFPEICAASEGVQVGPLEMVLKDANTRNAVQLAYLEGLSARRLYAIDSHHVQDYSSNGFDPLSTDNNDFDMEESGNCPTSSSTFRDDASVVVADKRKALFQFVSDVEGLMVEKKARYPKQDFLFLSNRQPFRFIGVCLIGDSFKDDSSGF